jgi:hypothetical protein
MVLKEALLATPKTRRNGQIVRPMWEKKVLDAGPKKAGDLITAPVWPVMRAGPCIMTLQYVYLTVTDFFITRRRRPCRRRPCDEPAYQKGRGCGT